MRYGDRVQITSISEYPIHQISYITAAPGNKGVVEQVLPVLLAEVDFLPPGLDAIIATSDLQGIDAKEGRLLGHLVAEELEILASHGKIPSRRKTGIILAGDLYAQLDKRGGIGDVREVWEAFNSCFSWVAGVAGNHDSFGNTSEDIKAFKDKRGINYLDGNIVDIDGVRIAGISGIIGNKNKPFRRPDKAFRKVMRELINKFPDILILHESPNDLDAKLLGNESIRAELEGVSNLLVICGHCYWKTPIIHLPKQVQVLNVDSRVVVLKPRSPLTADDLD